MKYNKNPFIMNHRFLFYFFKWTFFFNTLSYTILYNCHILNCMQYSLIVCTWLTPIIYNKTNKRANWSPSDRINVFHFATRSQWMQVKYGLELMSLKESTEQNVTCFDEWMHVAKEDWVLGCLVQVVHYVNLLPTE